MPPPEVLACRGYGGVKAYGAALVKRLYPLNTANTKAPALIAEALVLSVVLGVKSKCYSRDCQTNEASAAERIFVVE